MKCIGFSLLVGDRDAYHAQVFMEDIASRLNSRVQITSDGLRAYVDAVEGAFGMDVDYAQLVKLYAPARFVDLDERFCVQKCTGELYSCFSTDPICYWVFVRRSDDALFIVETRYEGWKINGRPDVSDTHRFLSLYQMPFERLDDVDIILPDGRRLSHPRPAAPRAGAADRR